MSYHGARVLLGLLLALVASPAALAQPVEPTEEEQQDLQVLDALQRAIARARDRVFPALVNVEPVIEDYEGGKKVKQLATGSGVVIDAQGHVITNYHVAGKAKLLFCTLSDKQRIRAHTVGSDPQTDIAIVQLHLEELEGELHCAALGDSRALQVGEFVMAMGSPLALARSLTLGVVSNVERVMGVEEDMGIEEGQKTGMLNLWIQTDAAINPGNSGGPLVNMRGEVVGINTRGATFANTIGFSVPINTVKQILDQLLEHGEVRRAWTGLRLQPRLREAGEASREGVTVAGVVESSPAERAGLRPGDVLTRFGDQPVSAEFIEEIPPVLNLMASVEIGESVTVTVLRDGKERQVTLVTQALQDFLGEEHEIEAWGVTVRSITDHMRREHRLASTAGVLITGMAAGKAFGEAEPPVRVDDVILALDNRPVSDLETFRQVASELIADRREPILVKLTRGRGSLLTAITPEYESGSGGAPPEAVPEDEPAAEPEEEN
jgi:serine protease Do